MPPFWPALTGFSGPELTLFPLGIRLLVGLLAPALVACQAARAPSGGSEPMASKAWADVPVPRGFQPVEDLRLAVPVDAGGYRAGELLFEGRSSTGAVEEYYRERMPQFGWSWDPAEEAWVKGRTQVRLFVKQVKQNSYNPTSGRVQVLLRASSERPSRNR